MALPGTTLLVRVDKTSFWFQEPLEDRLLLERWKGAKLEALQRLASHRLVCV